MRGTLRGSARPLVRAAGSCYAEPMDGIAHARAIAARVVPAYRPLGGLSFAYGQGSVVTGFSADADIDLVLVWDRAAPPAPEARPAQCLNEGTWPTEQFHQPGAYLDQFRIGTRPIDVAHIPAAVFAEWLDSVGAGGGWEQRAYPQPLAAVAGFAYGVLLADERGAGAAARARVAAFPPALAARSRARLAEQLPGYADALAGCTARGDGWLFHEILADALRGACATWFAAYGRYLPFHKRLHDWVARFGLDPELAQLERQLWLPGADLARKQALYVALAEPVLALPAIPE